LDGAEEASRRLRGRKVNGAPVGRRFVLALYTTRKLRPNERPLAAYKATEFYGNQGLLLPAELLAELTGFVGQLRHSGLMDDMMLKQFVVDRGVALHALNPNVVQHIGTHCTHSGHFHQSPSYGKW
jgi:hypothetical protein